MDIFFEFSTQCFTHRFVLWLHQSLLLRNVEFMRERLQEAGGADVLVYCAASNVMLNSYSGVSF